MIHKIKKDKKKSISEGIEKICSHNIEWYLEGKGLQLWDMDIEYIQNCLVNNYVSGELCSLSPNGKVVHGWWSIQN
ncbi:MAG: hypothetical protein FWC41_09920 [Firmicutes bacterium]|nr:hypothetical protein [Bacillota bacterium]